MSLVGFRANNHPQQVGRSGPDDEIDDRGTPQDFWDQLHAEYRFTLDVAAAPHNTKTANYYTRADDGLCQPWGPEWADSKGFPCPCSCHSFAAPRAKSGGSAATSFPAKRSGTGCTVNAANATGREPASDKLFDVPTRSSGRRSSPRSSDTLPQSEAANGNAQLAESRTTGVVSAGSPCPSSGPSRIGSDAFRTGRSGAHGAPGLDRSSRTTSSRSQPATALGPSRGTSSPPAVGVTGAREFDQQKPGPNPTDSLSSTPTCDKCERCTPRRSSVWANPPYSNLSAWLEKAWTEFWRPDGPHSIVMLLPANRPEQPWWQQWVEPYRDKPGSPLSVRFLPGRLRFIKPGATEVKPNERPPFGCCLLVWSR